MPETKPTPKPAKPTPDKNVELVEQYKTSLMETMDKRYKQLVEVFNKETNIATRYELRLRIEELQDTFKLLFRKGE